MPRQELSCLVTGSPVLGGQFNDPAGIARRGDCPQVETLPVQYGQYEKFEQGLKRHHPVLRETFWMIKANGGKTLHQRVHKDWRAKKLSWKQLGLLRYVLGFHEQFRSNTAGK